MLEDICKQTSPCHQGLPVNGEGGEFQKANFRGGPQKLPHESCKAGLVLSTSAKNTMRLKPDAKALPSIT